MGQNENTKLTTVKILKDVYSSFKKVSFDSDVTLQKLVNRTVERYVKDDDFRKEMNEYLYYFLSFASKGIDEAAGGTTFKEVS